MKTIEEEIWAYIDDACEPAERLEIEAKIASDPEYRQLHSELMQVHLMISAEELDEPSMSFTRNSSIWVGIKRTSSAHQTHMKPT